MCFVRKRMTPPNHSLVSWIGISGGAKTGVNTAASAMRNLGHALDVYEVCRACFPILRSADTAARATTEGAAPGGVVAVHREGRSVCRWRCCCSLWVCMALRT